jgi:tetratricopeptide (TPR) repeat protein
MLCFSDDNARALAHSSMAQCKQLADSKDHAQNKQAIPYCDEVVKRYPRAGWGYYWRGHAYAGAGQLDEAIQDIESGLKYLDRSDPRYEKWYKDAAAYFYILRAQHTWYVVGDPAKAIPDYSRALELYPKAPVALYNRAYFHYLNNKCQEAIPDFGEYANLWAGEPNHSLALVMQGRCYLKLGNRAAALANVQQLIAAQPRLAAQYGGAAALDLYDAAQRRQQARQWFQQALDAEKAGKLPEAFQNYSRAREYPLFNAIYPGDWERWKHEDYNKEDLALLHEMAPALQRIYLEQPVKPALPEEARRFNVQAEAAVREQRYDDAIAAFEKVVNLAPWWPQAHFNLAVLSAEQKKYQEAVNWMKGYLQWAPNAPDARQAQDKIYEWEGVAAQGGITPASLAGAWACKLTPAGSNITITYWYNLAPTAGNQFEMNPYKMYVPMPRAFASMSTQVLSRETTGYLSLTLKARKVQGFNNFKGQQTPATGEVAEDGRTMTVDMGEAHYSCQRE